MKAKVKLGLGVKNKKPRKGGPKKKRGGRGCTGFHEIVKKAKTAINKAKRKTLDGAVAVAIRSIKNIKKNNKGIKAPRVIPVPKSGGFLPLIPILSG